MPIVSVDVPPGKALLGREIRRARVAHVLAEAARSGRIESADARTIIVHELRKLNTNRKLLIHPRSSGAQAAIDKYRPNPPPRNDSPDALHADHVFAFPKSGPKLTEIFECTDTEEKWLQELRRLRQVVCLTAAENYLLEPIERQIDGPQKYAMAGISFVDPPPWDDGDL